jgi:hypothetical protein
LAETVVPGGRVELPTPAFSGPRSTGELPRHFGRQKIVRAQEDRSKRAEMELAGEISVFVGQPLLAVRGGLGAA